MFNKKLQSQIAVLENRLSDCESCVAAINNAMATIEFTPDGIVAAVNENFCHAMGYQAQEIIGKHHQIFCEPEFSRSSEYQAFWAKLVRGEFVSARFKRLRKDGTPIWLEASYNPVLDQNGRVVRVVKIALDITDKVNAELEQRSRLQALDRSMAIIEFSLDGVVLFANDLFLNVMGFQKQEVLGKHHRMFCDSAFANSPAYKELWSRLNRGEVVADLFKRIGKSGQAVWLEASYNPVFDASGKLVKVVKFASDVTQRMELLKTQTANAQVALNTSEDNSQAAQVGCRVIDEAAGEMRRIAQSIEKSSENIESLGKRSTEISSIVNTIRDIADQTNLLALNAAIEAARAGETGRGFAVVADEVRKLAERTGKSTTEISNMIIQIQTETKKAVETMMSMRVQANSGVDLAEQAKDSIAAITSGSQKVVEVVREFSRVLEVE